MSSKEKNKKTLIISFLGCKMGVIHPLHLVLVKTESGGRILVKQTPFN